MKIKVTALVLLVSTFCSTPAHGGLLRQPKVYNAVITTDENLTPSRAYPVVQPVVHEAGLTYPFGAFGPFGLYNAFNSYPGFYQPQGTAGVSSAQTSGRNSFYANHEPEPQLHDTPIETLPGVKPLPDTNLPLRDGPTLEEIPEPNNSIVSKLPEEHQLSYEEGSTDSKSPLQLNEYGLPPSLIPLSSYNGNGQNPQAYNLQGYPYNFPVLHDSFGNYNPTQYQSVLPPFGYYPQLAQPNPYYSQNVAPSGPADNIIDPLQINRSGREQELHMHRHGGREPELQMQHRGREQDLPDASRADLQDATGSVESAPEVSAPAADPTEAAKSEDSKAETGAPAAESIPDSIKNNANKNKDIPDVPPPPIPSGAKDAEQQ